MAQLIPGDASLILTRLLILTVWGVTPFSWLALILRAVRSYLHAYTPYSIDANVWSFIVRHMPRSFTAALESGLSLRLRWIPNLFYIYCAAEVAFSLYYWHLSRRIQKPGPRPLYGRRFLRGVFAQALQAGLKPASGDDTAPSAKQQSTYASAVSSSTGSSDRNGLVSRTAASGQDGLDERSAPSHVRQRLGRLRAASFVPHFVSAPIAEDDPRAIKFQQDQARWFFGVPFEQITRRQVMHWLAWSLFATELETLEAERDGSIALEDRDGRWSTDHKSAAVEAQGLGPASATPSTFNSPMPASTSTFGGPPPSFSSGQAHTSIEEQEDVRGARAKDGEWDPTAGDRLRFLEYCLELLETRQGKAYPEEPPEGSTSLKQHGRTDLQGSTRATLLKPKPVKPTKAGPSIRMMRLTIDPVRTRSRPLLCYLVTNTLSYLTIRRAIRGGFQLCTEGRLPYLYRPASASPDGARVDDTPLIMLHGLGIGLAQYASLVSFFLRSATFAHRPILILLQPNISQSILSPHFLRPFGHHETTSAFRSILARHSWHSIDVLSHSYGSLVHSWLIKSLGSQVRRSCFVDPVCFQLWVPFVCSNFVYKRAQTPIELLMRYFVAREVGTANTLCRYFDWSSNILWPNEIDHLQDGKRTRFYLAEEDAILSAKDTLEYLVESGVPRANVYYGKEKAHGEMLMHGGDEFNDIVAWLSMEVSPRQV